MAAAAVVVMEVVVMAATAVTASEAAMAMADPVARGQVVAAHPLSKRRRCSRRAATCSRGVRAYCVRWHPYACAAAEWRHAACSQPLGGLSLSADHSAIQHRFAETLELAARHQHLIELMHQL